MSLHFQSSELLRVGVQARGTLRVWPLGGKATTQRLVVADGEGTVRCVEYQPSTNSLENRWTVQPEPVEVGAMFLLTGKKSIITFASHGETVRGYSNKGKEFDSLETAMTEPIRHILVNGERIYVAGDYSVSAYEGGEDRGFAMMNDKVNALAQYDDFLVTGCYDQSVRWLSDDLRIVQEVRVDGPVTALTRLRGEKGGIIYGTEGGAVGILRRLDSGDVEKDWLYDPGRDMEHSDINPDDGMRSGVVSICTSNILVGTEDMHVIYALEDGTIEVLSILTGQPVLLFSTKLAEGVCSVGVGYVRTPRNAVVDYAADEASNKPSKDIVACTYSGRIIVLNRCAAPTDALVGTQSAFETVSAVPPSVTAEGSGETDVSKLQVEVSELARRLAAEQEKLDLFALKKKKPKKAPKKVEEKKPNNGVIESDTLALPASFAVKTTLKLMQNGSHLLSIDAAAETYAVIIECSAGIHTITPQSKSTDVIFSETPSNVLRPARASKGDQDAPLFRATVRPVSTGSKIALVIRFFGGKAGVLRVYCIKSANPRSCAVCETLVGPLILHSRTEQEPARSAMHELELRGNFSVRESFSWAQRAFPDLPAAAPSEEKYFYFVCSFTKLPIIAFFGEGKCKFKGADVHVLNAIQKAMEKAADLTGGTVRASFTRSKEADVMLIRTLESRLAPLRDTKMRIDLAAAVQELSLESGDAGDESGKSKAVPSFIPAKYSDLLEKREELASSAPLITQATEYVQQVFRETLRSQCEILHENDDGRAEKLEQLMHARKYNVERVIELFTGEGDHLSPF